VAAALSELSSSMRVAERLGTMLSEQNDVLADLVATAGPVAAAVATDDGKKLDSLLASTRDTLHAVAAQQEALRVTIDRLPGTLVSARRTLAQFEGVADQATPTLKALRPLTGNLDQVVAEIEAFDQSANRALTSLEPVLDKATALLDQAAPAVAQLRQTGPPLERSARSLKPVSDQLLVKNLNGVMEFVRKWALSTNGHDGISHYFRGVFYVTPTTLKSLVRSLLPTQVQLPKATAAPKGGATGPLDLGSVTSGLLGGGTDSRSGLLGGLTGGLLSGNRSVPAPGAFGLTPEQEQSMVQQLLGGN
jgi:phospholipid/cholesterol/gamma-HCH transport system substrate-binding protein